MLAVSRRLLLARSRLRAKFGVGFPEAGLIPSACKVLQDLGVSASICFEGHGHAYWAPFQEHPNVLAFEMEHGKLGDRYEYNERCLRRARRLKSTVVGKHAGFCDLFVPIIVEDEVWAYVVTGPFATSRPTSADILRRWQQLTGRQGHPDDPEFSKYLELTLSTLILEDDQVAAFQALVERLAELIVSRRSSTTAHTDVQLLGPELKRVRFVEEVWEAARVMLDERTSRVWATPQRVDQRAALGLHGVPEHVVVGLFVTKERDSDRVDDLLRRHAFQRYCVELARDTGNVVSGRIGDHGVTFLGASTSSRERGRRTLVELGERAASIARRRFGLAMHLGVSTLSAPLPEQYQVALSAAESAVAHNLSVVHSAPETTKRSSLGALRIELARQVEETPKVLPARFDRFLEAVAIRSGYRLELAQIHLEAGFERMIEGVVTSGALDPKGLHTIASSLERETRAATTMNELFAAYRRAARDVADAVTQPATAHQDRSLRRAEEYLERHYSETLTLAQVARVSGFAPSYFSRLFHARHKMTFVAYLTKLRIRRAKELLTSTSLNLQRVAELSGFARGRYLNRIFKEATSQTPLQYRRRLEPLARPIR
jgi:AraC-like DNA-binding protein